MAVDDQVKVLEDEFKLIKSELRQTLVSVRDFLLDLKLPPMQEEESLPVQPVAISNNDEPEPESEVPPSNDQPDPSQAGGNGDMGGSNNGDQSQVQDNAQDSAPQNDNPIEEEYGGAGCDEIEDLNNEDKGVADNTDDTGMTSGDIPSEKTPEDKIEKPEEASQLNSKDSIQEVISADSQINLLANLIRWVSTAKKEIGNVQLAAFLDVYAIGGNMSDEVKDVILHLAEVATDPVSEPPEGEKNPIVNEQISLCMEINSLSGQLPDELKKSIRHLTEILIQETIQRNKADIWSKLLLELHGIMAGNTASLQYLVTRESREAEQLQKEQEALKKAEQLKAENSGQNTPPKKTVKPAKLRLVLPGSDGSEQELDLGNLFIASDQEDNEDNGHH
jgi:hypothetical protein